MQFVTIPFDYYEMPDVNRAAVVPICVPRDDQEGQPIAWGWFEALARISGQMRSLATRYLDDVWRSSELSEGALQGIWRLHGEDFGHRPEGRLYAHAVWQARDLRSGTWRERRGRIKALEDLDYSLRERALADWREHQETSRRIDFGLLSKRLEEGGAHDASVMLDLLLDGCTWNEVGERLGKSADAARMMFHRKTGEIMPRRSSD